VRKYANCTFVIVKTGGTDPIIRWVYKMSPYNFVFTFVFCMPLGEMGWRDVEGALGGAEVGRFGGAVGGGADTLNEMDAND
jgi:hypothetical protein